MSIPDSARIPIAAFVGGVVLFAWGAAAHMALPLGDMGIENIPNEQPMLDAFRANIAESGLYFFPPLEEESPGMTDAERAALWKKFEEKYRRGPSGLLVIHVGSREALTPGQLGTEFLCNLAAALIAAIVLAHVSPAWGYTRRVMLVVLFGLFTSVMSGLQFWNWYGFPTEFMIAGVVEELVGAGLMGLAIAAIVRPNYVGAAEVTA